MFSASLTPQITILTHLTVCSRTLIDNIFTNSVEEDSTSGNLECCIADHLAVSYLSESKCLTTKQLYKI